MAKRPKMGFKVVRVSRANGSSLPIGYAKWDGQPPRQPKKGELYLSGCEGHEAAYEAPNDLSSEYFIATRTEGRSHG